LNLLGYLEGMERVVTLGWWFKSHANERERERERVMMTVGVLAFTSLS